LKVRGFQVAPAELEGHLLGHPFVADVCVVGASDEFSGEAPMAFVVPSSEARRLIKTGPRGMSEAKIAISKASFYHPAGASLDVNQSGDSTYRMPRLGINISQGELSLWI
jgi:acyl-CoA synthetase (AMP-forming)/AMP-acid ligase II